MSGSDGNGAGTVYLAHAWVPWEYRYRTVGPWEWWNVYRSEPIAARQAVQRATGYGWRGLARWEVLAIGGEPHDYLSRVLSRLSDQIEGD